jgi:glyoxylase-like metal-dependent hydrolase (beta-lactamase superfamily II)
MMPAAYERVGDEVRKVLAPNPGPMTLDGTNTWVIGNPATGPVIIVDPGPLDEDHLQRVLEVAGGRTTAIWITHRHHDHTDGAARMAELSGCLVYAADPAFASDPETELTGGESMGLGDLQVRVIATAGHTSDSVSFLITGAGQPSLLLTGDMVLGRGTTVITHPDGDLAAYLDSLETMIETVDDHQVAEILPGHGDRVSDPAGILRYYRRHRLERLEQVRAAVAAGDRTPMDVVRRVYVDADPAVWPAAEQSVRAQLDYLQQHG